jgi:crotonobetainyl-CoA:carnitine CoA-transferase CaiB-like acyl-CoA transferase
MDAQAIRPILNQCITALNLSDVAGKRLNIMGAGSLVSCFPVTELATASVGAAGLALADLLTELGHEPSVTVDRRLASLWFGFSIKPQGWALPEAWDAIAGDYRANDGWIKLHTNAPHHKAAALSVLECADDRSAVSAAVRTQSAEALETAVVAAGGCAAALRPRDTWLTHPQGRIVSAQPLIHWDASRGNSPSTWAPTLQRPLAGLRVLDLTRILAGPVATRFLAGFGADVLRIDPPGWEEPALEPEVTIGKRCARLDLRQKADRTRFEQLLSKADILVHGYRRGALDALGLGTAARQAIRPGLIDVSLNAYGHEGPWADRRGFDSLVQFSSGIADAGMAWRKTDTPVSLPVQALDHATGYLMAAAALRSLRARMTGEDARIARVSLARTANLLFNQNACPNDEPLAARDQADLSSHPEQTPWGVAHRIKPPLLISNCVMHWDSPPQRLGSAAPAWI